MNKLKSETNDGIKIDLVSENDVDKDKRDEIFNRQPSIDAIPDLDVLTGCVVEILEYLEKPETKKLLKTNEGAVKMYLNNKYLQLPYGIITLLMEDESRTENIERLLKMFELLKSAKKGDISLDDAEKTVSEDINQRYLYSKYGSKEAFERAIYEDQKKNKNKTPIKAGKARIEK
jgi:hypothetical protein